MGRRGKIRYFECTALLPNCFAVFSLEVRHDELKNQRTAREMQYTRGLAEDRLRSVVDNLWYVERRRGIGGQRERDAAKNR